MPPGDADGADTRRITKVQRKGKRGDTFAVYIDDGLAFEVDQETLIKMNLKEGQTIDANTEREIRYFSERAQARVKALRLLAVRSRSISEMKQRLTMAGFSQEVIDDAVQWLVSLNYLDDVRFAEEFVRTQTRLRPMGRRRLHAELKARGVLNEAIQKAVDSLEEDEVHIAKEAARKGWARYKKLPSEKARRRLMGYLQRRGFDYSTIRAVVSEFLPE